MSISLAAKNLPIADTCAEARFFRYDIDTTKQQAILGGNNYASCIYSWVNGGIGLAAAIVCGVSGNFQTAALYVILSGSFLYSAYATWKKRKDGKRDK